MKDYYKILNLDHNATIDEIKRSYRQLALKYHPDRNNGNRDYEEIFKLITEAYTVLNDVEKRKKYDSIKFQEKKEEANSKQKNEITPATFLKIFYDIKNTLLNAEPNTINSFKLFQTLNELLTVHNIDFLIKNATPEMNRMIVNEILICSSFIYETSYDVLRPKLLILAGENEALINTIKLFKKPPVQNNLNTERPLQKSPSNFRDLFLFLFAIAVVFAMIYNCSNGTSKSSNEEPNNVANGDLNNTFIPGQSDTVNTPTNITPEPISEEEKMIAEGWQESNIDNGQMPLCYNFRPKKGNTDNMLEVHVGGGTNVAIKVMNVDTEKCVRYVYINSGSTYQIKNIPQGIYYLKIAYGKNWYSKTQNDQCVGKFLRNPLYEKGTDIMDFNIQYHGNSYSIPSFQLQLDVISNQNVNTFSSQNISEDEFND